ncbi:MAG: hypothetical protein M0Z94_14710 [Dehalococcoidales bacterium]|nr:hypothetical protein [Dehalococcoidales bacterium]
MKRRKRTFLNVSFAVIWLAFPLLYQTAAVQQAPLPAAAALVMMGVGIVAALAT